MNIICFVHYIINRVVFQYIPKHATYYIAKTRQCKPVRVFILIRLPTIYYETFF